MPFEISRDSGRTWEPIPDQEVWSELDRPNSMAAHAVAQMKLHPMRAVCSPSGLLRYRSGTEA